MYKILHYDKQWYMHMYYNIIRNVLMDLHHYSNLVPRPRPEGGKLRVWFTSSRFWGAQDAVSDHRINCHDNASFELGNASTALTHNVVQ